VAALTIIGVPGAALVVPGIASALAEAAFIQDSAAVKVDIAGTASTIDPSAPSIAVTAAPATVFFVDPASTHAITSAVFVVARASPDLVSSSLTFAAFVKARASSELVSSSRAFVELAAVGTSGALHFITALVPVLVRGALTSGGSPVHTSTVHTLCIL